MKSAERIEETGLCTLYQGDALKILPELIKGRIVADMVCTDPPYLLTSGGAGNAPGTMQGKFSRDSYDNGGHLVACDLDWPDFMPHLYAIMGRGHAYVMTNAKNMRDCLNAAHDTGERPGKGFQLHNILDWNKKTATANRWYMKNLEFTCMFYKGKARAINDCSSMAGVHIPPKAVTAHPTEKPVALMEYYIRNSTKPGDLVIDPFMGSGATGVACARLGRRFVGIELDEQWFDVALGRMEAAQAPDNGYQQPFI